MIRLNTILAIFVVVFAQVWAGDDDRTVWDRDSDIQGGYDDLDIRKPHVKFLADLAVVDFNARSNSRFYQPLVEIVDANKGRGLPKNKYWIKLLLGTSSCSKNLPQEVLRQCTPSLAGKQGIEAKVTEDPDGVVREQIYHKDIPLEVIASEKCLHAVGNRLPFAEAESWARFRRFVNVHNRTYKSEEEAAHRYQAYKDNMQKAKVLQSTELGTAVYGETIFSDLSEEEFFRRYANRIPTLDLDTHLANTIPVHYEPSRSINFTESIIWTTYAAKDQGHSKCCWAFALVAATEVMYNLKTKQHGEILSEQQVADCTSGDCITGGYAWDAAEEMMHQSGFIAGKDYPSYDGGEHECRSRGLAAKVKIVNRTLLPQNERAMFRAFNDAPIVVAVCSGPLQNYQKGTIYNPEGQEHCQVDHAVMISEGWRITEDDKQRGNWTIHNSWGAGWGEEGNARVNYGVDALKITHQPFIIDVEVL